MMASHAPQFIGFVTDQGRLTVDDRPGFDRLLKSLAGKEIVVTVKKKGSQRSLDQNAYIHAEPIPRLADHLGYTIPEMKLILMGECFGWKTVGGHEIPIKPHTSDMTVDECQYFIDWVVPWAMTEHKVTLMLPNETEVRA